MCPLIALVKTLLISNHYHWHQAFYITEILHYLKLVVINFNITMAVVPTLLILNHYHWHQAFYITEKLHYLKLVVINFNTTMATTKYLNSTLVSLNVMWPSMVFIFCLFVYFCYVLVSTCLQHCIILNSILPQPPLSKVCQTQKAYCCK